MEFHRAVHSLAGTGGTFGASYISSISGELEIVLKNLIHKTEELNGETIIEIDPETKNIIESLVMNLRIESQNWDPGKKEAYLHYESDGVQEKSNKLIFLAEDDELIAGKIVEYLENSDFIIKHFKNLKDFDIACANEEPAVIIMDMVFAEGDTADALIIEKINNPNKYSTPVIFISYRSDIQARLSAARAGAVRYFTKPIDMEKIKQTIGDLTSQKPEDPFRILLIDDDETLLEFYKTILEEKGMIVKTLHNPLESLKVLSSFQPDITVTDVYMPECSGPELAQIIRQDDFYARMPIMFLSTEGNIDRQLAAMNLGGDDFLTKPVDPDHLVSAITSRVKRHRHINQLAVDLENALRESKYRHIALDQHSIVAITDTEENIKDVNDKFCEISGYSRKELIGENYNILMSDRVKKELYDDLKKTIREGRVWHGITCNRKKSEEEYWLESTVVPFLNESGHPYQHIWVLTDITQLRASMKEAENANRAKSQFLSSMSHELRTPLNAILGFGQLMKIESEHLLDNEQMQNLNEIILAGNHLLALINEILDLSKIESGQIDLFIESVPLAKVISECLALITPLARSKNIEIILKCSNSIITGDKIETIDIFARSDSKRLKQILLNLLSNGVKYNRDNGKIFIEIDRADNDQIKITVRDTGPGMTDIQQSQLFTTFNRPGMEHTRIEGTGIGLVITKNIVEMLGGSIDVESVYGEGSSFIILIPEEIIKSKNENLSGHNLDEGHTSFFSQINTVLYIANNPSNLRIVTHLLAHQPNIHMLSSHDPIAGLELAKKSNPDLILLDMDLPQMDGFKVLKNLINHSITEKIPAVAISANISPENISETFGDAVIRFITKPIDGNQLLKAINDLLIEKNKKSTAN